MIVGQRQNFNNDNLGEFGANFLEAGMRQHKFTLIAIIIINIFATDVLSQPFLCSRC